MPCGDGLGEEDEGEGLREGGWGEGLGEEDEGEGFGESEGSGRGRLVCSR